jgi:hypothetical protein
MSETLPLLNKGLTSEYFNLSGKIPDDSILLALYVKGETMYGALSFSILVEIPSYPWEF